MEEDKIIYHLQYSNPQPKFHIQTLHSFIHSLACSHNMQIDHHCISNNLHFTLRFFDLETVFQMIILVKCNFIIILYVFLFIYLVVFILFSVYIDKMHARPVMFLLDFFYIGVFCGQHKCFECMIVLLDYALKIKNIANSFAKGYVLIKRFTML